jgi:hypothetical protein
MGVRGSLKAVDVLCVGRTPFFLVTLHHVEIILIPTDDSYVSNLHMTNIGNKQLIDVGFF